MVHVDFVRHRQHLVFVFSIENVFAELFLNSCFDVEVTQSQLDDLPEGIMNMDIH